VILTFDTWTISPMCPPGMRSVSTAASLLPEG
jgi:hypothetical protein